MRQKYEVITYPNCHFYSRIPWGMRLASVVDENGKIIISTHASHGGCDTVGMMNGFNGVISTHASHGGCDRYILYIIVFVLPNLEVDLFLTLSLSQIIIQKSTFYGEPFVDLQSLHLRLHQALQHLLHKKSNFSQI